MSSYSFCQSVIKSCLQQRCQESKCGKGFKFLFFFFQISLNEYLQRIYLDHLTNAVLNPRFTFVEITDAEIVIRYHGARGNSSMRVSVSPKQDSTIYVYAFAADLLFTFPHTTKLQQTTLIISSQKIWKISLKGSNII